MEEITSRKLKQVSLQYLIPVVLNKRQQEIDISQYQPITEEEYRESCQKAELLGYKSIHDPRAYGGIYYTNDQGEIWIHRLANLALKMNFETLGDAEEAGYAVDDYLEYVDLTPEELLDLLSKREMQNLYEELCISHDENELVYLSDGVYLNSEGEFIDTKPCK